MGDSDILWTLKQDAFHSYSIYTAMKTALLNFCLDNNLFRFRNFFVEDIDPGNDKLRLASNDIEKTILNQKQL